MTFSPATPAWQSPVLDGQVYGEPLEAGGRVDVATENDTVYALAADTGAILWSSQRRDTRCPRPTCRAATSAPTVGITGTPVIDDARGEIFAVADELSTGTPAHVLVGLEHVHGRAVMLDEDVDPPGRTPPPSCSAPG